MKINCPHCRGQGRVDLDTLSPPLHECYSVLKRLGPATREQVHQASKAKGVLTMTYKRLARLERLGLVKSLGSERPVRFQVV